MQTLHRRVPGLLWPEANRQHGGIHQLCFRSMALRLCQRGLPTVSAGYAGSAGACLYCALLLNCCSKASKKALLRQCTNEMEITTANTSVSANRHFINTHNSGFGSQVATESAGPGRARGWVDSRGGSTPGLEAGHASRTGRPCTAFGKLLMLIFCFSQFMIPSHLFCAHTGWRRLFHRWVQVLLIIFLLGKRKGRRKANWLELSKPTFLHNFNRQQV